MPYPRTIRWVRLLAVTGFVALGVLIYVRYTQALQQVGRLTDAQNVVGATNNLTSLLKDIETSSRGYLLTGADSYLDPFRTATAALPTQVNRLKQTIGSDAAAEIDIPHFIDLVNAEVAASQAAIDARRAGQLTPADSLRLTNTGKHAMDAVRADATTVAATARARVQLERQTSQRDTRTTRYLMDGAFVFALGMVALATLETRRELKRRGQAEHALTAAFAEVEARVSARTRELVDANARLDSSERRLRLIAEFGLVHLFTLGPDGSASFVTRGLPAVTGRSAEDLLGFGWIEAAHADDRARLRDVWSDATGRAAPFEIVFRFDTSVGSPRWFKLRAMPVADDAGRIREWVAAAIDMHDQQEMAMLRDELLTREHKARADAELANRLKDEFLATVSHELRTPLNAIVGWAHLLRTDAAGDPGRALDAIERNAFAQARLIDDLLDVSRMAKGRFTLTVRPQDLRRSVQAALETLRPASSAKQVDVQFIGPEPVPMTGDPDRLQQIAWNLVSNAVKFTPSGGHITVEVGRAGSRACLRVTDTGEGIDPAFLTHVFEPFRQGRSGSSRTGLGLGLAIVRQIVELHGGTVSVESQGLRRGTTFTVLLPLTAATEREADVASAPVGSRSTLRVLLAEDDEDSAATLGAFLTHRGCEVRSTRTASECLSVYDRWDPDVLLCDIALPDADGYAVLRQVQERRRPRRIPAIALTALARDEDRARALSAGFVAHVAKPFDPDQLFEIIARATSPRDDGHRTAGAA